MDCNKIGGTAFPCEVNQDDERFQGVSLRDYFIAHAPAEPQPWFEPVMPPHPDIPKLSELSAADREDWNSELIDYAPSKCSETLRSFAERREAASESVKEWNKKKEKERYIQWPSAWADAMLKARDQS